jgi:vacuolar-type H+-ATPase subunit H
MTKPKAPDYHVDDPAEQAIATVLRAEREAHQAVERAQVEADRLAEDARSSARSVADRTERRVRAVVGAFERELASRLAEVDAEAARITTPSEPGAAELGALDLAVSALARELIGARP